MDVFHVTEDKITKELRRRAKVINFGIIYGISPFWSCSSIEISNTEAKNYIDQYFSKYPGIRNYMDKLYKNVEVKKFCFYAFWRRIHIPYINDRLATRRNFAERSAINAPIQGGAADLIKFAMHKVFQF